MTADYCQRSGQHKQGSNCSQTSPQSPHNPLALSQPLTLSPLLFPLAHRLQIYPALLCGSLGFSLTLSTLLLCPLLSLHWHHLSFLKTAQESVSPCTRHAFSLPWPANVPGAGHLSLTRILLSIYCKCSHTASPPPGSLTNARPPQPTHFLTSLPPHTHQKLALLPTDLLETLHFCLKLSPFRNELKRLPQQQSTVSEREGELGMQLWPSKRTSKQKQTVMLNK